MLPLVFTITTPTFLFTYVVLYLARSLHYFNNFSALWYGAMLSTVSTTFFMVNPRLVRKSLASLHFLADQDYNLKCTLGQNLRKNLSLLCLFFEKGMLHTWCRTYGCSGCTCTHSFPAPPRNYTYKCTSFFAPPRSCTYTCTHAI